jgi:hypothetical protein
MHWDPGCIVLVRGRVRPMVKDSVAGTPDMGDAITREQVAAVTSIALQELAVTASNIAGSYYTNRGMDFTAHPRAPLPSRVCAGDMRRTGASNPQAAHRFFCSRAGRCACCLLCAVQDGRGQKRFHVPDPCVAQLAGEREREAQLASIATTMLSSVDAHTNTKCITIFLRINTHVYILYAYTQMYTAFICTCTQIYTRTNVYTNLCKHARTHARTCACTCAG